MDPSRRRLFGRSSRSAPFRPPWSVPEAMFADACTRCGDCLKACPTGLLRPGDGGFPAADFSAAACTFCGECAAACGSGAIARDRPGAPWSYTVVIGDACLARRRVECRVCGEACQAHDACALRFRPAVGGVYLPEVDEAACTGCGACLALCPTGAIMRVARVARAPLALCGEPS